MLKLVSSVLALGLASGPIPAPAQTSAAQAPVAQAADALPMESRLVIGDVVPGVGPTPGVILMIDTPAMLCAKSAARAADGLMAPSDAMTTCNEAIVSGVVDRDDTAATFVNRGVLLMSMKRPAEAKQDFDRALEVNPDTAEALINRGAILLGEGKASEALADLDRGIALGPERPERAYYQRAMARETLKDIKGAYADYKMADSLRPGWEPVTAELARFKVVSR